MAFIIAIVLGIAVGLITAHYLRKYRAHKNHWPRLSGSLIGFFAFVFALFAFGPRGNPASADLVKRPKHTDRSSMAYGACKQAVLDQLRSPSTAKFPWFADSAREVLQDDKRYEISGHVDAQNGFGATIRANWICDTTFLGGDRNAYDAGNWVSNVKLFSR